MTIKKYAALGVHCLLVMNFLVCSGGQKTPAVISTAIAAQWVPIDNNDWSVYMGAPEYHFTLAKEYLQKGDKENASSELMRGNSFLVFQMNRLSLASKQIQELSNSIAAGQNSPPPTNFDTATTNALKVFDTRFAMLPVNVGWTTDFEEAYKYHFDRAKKKLMKNDGRGAASEIHFAAAFMKMEAVYTGLADKPGIDTIRNELNDLGMKVQSGKVKEVKDLERVFERAIAFVARKE